MSREAKITMDFSAFSDKISDVVKFFARAGWEFYDKNGIAEFLPEKDYGSNNWQRAAINNDSLKFMLDEMQRHGEPVGIVLFHDTSGSAVELLAEDTENIVLSIDRERRTVSPEPDAPTDFCWYYNEIIAKFYAIKAPLLKFEFTETSY